MTVERAECGFQGVKSGITAYLTSKLSGCDTLRAECGLEVVGTAIWQVTHPTKSPRAMHRRGCPKGASTYSLSAATLYPTFRTLNCHMGKIYPEAIALPKLLSINT